MPRCYLRGSDGDELRAADFDVRWLQRAIAYGRIAASAFAFMALRLSGRWIGSPGSIGGWQRHQGAVA